jgi:hypothetical protein
LQGFDRAAEVAADAGKGVVMTSESSAIMKDASDVTPSTQFFSLRS